jgi:hypothetical protein
LNGKSKLVKDTNTNMYLTTPSQSPRFYTLKKYLTVILSPTTKDPRIHRPAVKAGSKTDPATNTD